MKSPSKTYSFTNRAKTFGNMWRVYSYKCDKSFVLHSDRELAHWILFLEFDPDVESFDLNPPSRRLDVGIGQKETTLDAEVVRRNGLIEWHEIKMGYFDKEVYSTPQIDLQRNIAQKNHVKYVIFNDSDFMPLKSRIMPLLKVEACLAFGRRISTSAMVEHEVGLFFGKGNTGTLGRYLDKFSDQELERMLYIFSRKFSEGVIDVEFTKSFFSRKNVWVTR
ncbi:MAG: hypothetical protein LBJ33_24330 [Pseudomonas putida]|jgi:hypothetical protein|nr:hypothetical protein [Pseudomonas putida]